MQKLGLYNLLPRSRLSTAAAYLCELAPHFCRYLEEGAFDWHDEIDNSKRYADKEAHNPSGSGWRNLIHYGQIIKYKQFQRFDFGEETNLEKYGQPYPPLYDLSAIRVKMAIFHGDADVLSNTKDVAWLLDEKQSGLRSDLVIFTKLLHFGHSSFQMATDMSYLNDVINLVL